MRRAVRQAVLLRRAKAAVAIALGTRAENNTSQTTYTFSGVVLPAPDANGYVIIAVGMRSGNAIANVAVTVDWGAGVLAASPVIIRTSGAGSAVHTGLYQVFAPHSLGATATVVVTVTLAATRCAIVPYQVVTSAPTAQFSHFSATANPTHTFTVPPGGGTIIAAAGDNGVSATPTNYSEDTDALIGGSATCFTTGKDTSRTGPTVFTTTFGSAASNPAGVAAVWGP